MLTDKKISTSLDDSAVEDMKFTDLLAKYETPAIFSIPKNNNKRSVLKSNDILELSSRHEQKFHFHLWRYSWEVYENNVVDDLEDCFKVMANYQEYFKNYSEAIK